MQNNLIFTAILICLVSSPSFADGGATYEQKCVVCHGAQAQGVVAMSSPRLAGQSSAYMQRQLKHFKSGVRGKVQGDNTGMQMVAIAAGLDEAAIVEVSDYLSTLPAERVAETVDGDVRTGEKLYQAYCGSCHGSDATGNEMLNSPNLALLSSAYFKAQYQKFLNGQRGHDKTDKFGRQMKMMAAAMPDQKSVDDVAAYLQSIAISE